MDFYRDYFTREQLVAAIAKAQFIPGHIGELGLFEVRGLTSTTMAVEELVKETVGKSTAIPRGSPPQVMGLGKRKVHTFSTETYAKTMSVYADEVLNARAAGPNGAAEVIEARRNETVQKLRNWADYQHEYMRMQVVLNPDNAIGSKPAAQNIALSTDATKTRQEVFTKIIKPMESALDGIAFTGLRAECSDGFWGALIENKAIKDTYLNTQAAGELRNDPRDSFVYGGVQWERIRGDSDIKITDDKAIILPTGVSGMFYTGFAPDDTLDSVGAGAMGAPYYLRAEPMKGGKGWEITCQTHPVMVCARPQAILTIGLS